MLQSSHQYSRGPKQISLPHSREDLALRTLNVIQAEPNTDVIMNGNNLLLLKDVKGKFSVDEIPLGLDLGSVICSKYMPQTRFPPGYLIGGDKLYYFSGSAVYLRGQLGSSSFSEHSSPLNVAYFISNEARGWSSISKSEPANGELGAGLVKLLHEQAPNLSIEGAFQAQGGALVYGLLKFKLINYPFLATLRENQTMLRVFPDTYLFELHPLEDCGIVCVTDASRMYKRGKTEKYDFIGVFDYNLSRVDIVEIPGGCLSGCWNLDAVSYVGSGSQIFIPFFEPTENADFLVFDNSQVLDSRGGFGGAAETVGLEVVGNVQGSKFILVKDSKKPPRAKDEAIKALRFFKIGERQILFAGYETHFRVSLGALDAIIQLPNAYSQAYYSVLGHYVLENPMLDECVYIPVLLTSRGGLRCLKIFEVNLNGGYLTIFSADFERKWGLPIFCAVDEKNRPIIVSRSRSGVWILTAKLH
jgi:hypothetical protein